MVIVYFVLVFLIAHVVSWSPLPRINHIMYRQRRIQSNTAKHMFSGIVEEMGTVEDINFTTKMKMWDGTIGEGVELTIRATVAVEEAYIGCSIAVNGVCLTATAYDVTKVRRRNCCSYCCGSLYSLFNERYTYTSSSVHRGFSSRNITKVQFGSVGCW